MDDDNDTDNSLAAMLTKRLGWITGIKSPSTKPTMPDTAWRKKMVDQANESFAKPAAKPLEDPKLGQKKIPVLRNAKARGKVVSKRAF